MLSYRHEIFTQVILNMQLQHTKSSYKSVAIYPEMEGVRHEIPRQIITNFYQKNSDSFRWAKTAEDIELSSWNFYTS